MSLIYKLINRNLLKIKRKEEKKEKLNNKISELKTQRGSVSKGRIDKNDNNRIKIHNKIKSIEKKIKKLNKEIKECKKENKELNKDKKKFSRLFKSKTTETAEKRFNEFKNNENNLHEATKTFFNRLPKTFERVTNHIKNKFLPSTNNVIENYFGSTIPKLLKRKYRTLDGLKRRIKLSDIRWIKRNVLKSG
jgi:chromosome segregation ATPase